MLAVTSSAAAAIKEITGAIPEAAGIRLARLPAPPMNGSAASTQLEAQPAPAPEAADEVVREDGANLFIEPSLVPDLDDKVLDVEMDGPQATFVLSPQD